MKKNKIVPIVFILILTIGLIVAFNFKDSFLSTNKTGGINFDLKNSTNQNSPKINFVIFSNSERTNIATFELNNNSEEKNYVETKDKFSEGSIELTYKNNLNEEKTHTINGYISSFNGKIIVKAEIKKIDKNGNLQLTIVAYDDKTNKNELTIDDTNS